MATTFDDERHLIELQAKNGRITGKSAATALKSLTEGEIERLERTADDFRKMADFGMYSAYLAKATELRREFPQILEKVMSSTSARGVGADLVKATRRYALLDKSKRESDMSNAEKATFYASLVKTATTPAEARQWSEFSDKFAEAAAKEGD